MKINLNWLREFVDFDESPEEIADILTFLNFECESITRIHRSVEGVVVGKVLESKPHPNADKLQVTKVDIGGEVLPIVCGAPNCRTGLTVAVAPVGTKIGEITIDARKLRGEMSQGMILSEAEMGISENHGGILELPDSFAIGSNFADEVPAEDVVLEFEVTVNRPDALSHIGMARELAAYWKRPFRLPSYDVEEITGRKAADEIAVEIQSPEACPRYVARKVSGVTIQESPPWMKARLASIGQRPISNVVDITNYILFELGQPLHAFDASQIHQDRIVVRMGGDGERFTTLDDKERKLLATDIVIADPDRGVALGGVMGGANSEVVDATEDVIIEAAYFDPPTVRRTAKRLGLFSEASRRFERGADPGMAPLAAARCAEMFRRYAGAQVLTGQVDAYPNVIDPKPISFRPARTSVVLGLDVDAAESQRIFESLEMTVDSEDDELIVTPPTFRIHDLEREVDLIEEVARHVGYDKVPTAEESRVVLGAQDPPLERLMDTTVDSMVALGFREAISSAMTSGEDHEAFDGGLKPFAIHRPINPEMSVYRASLVPALLRVLEHNLNRGFDDVMLFEVGQVGGGGWLDEDGGQRLHLGFVMTGHMPPPAYDRPAKALDLQDVKTVVRELARGLTLDMPDAFSYDTPDNLLLGMKLTGKQGDTVGFAGLLKEEVAERFGVDRPVYVGEIDVERWVGEESEDLRLPGIIGTYQSFSRYPASTRDLALIVPQAVPAETVEATLRKHANELLEDVSLFDLYEGEPLADNERSLAWRLTFRADDRTLTDKDIDPVVEAIVAGVEGLEGVRLRG